MKLNVIAERSNEPIRDSAKSIGDLIQYINSNFNKKSAEAQAIQTFLQRPTARSWQNAKWVIDSAIKQAGNTPEALQRAKKWAFLKSLTSPTVSASVYDVDQKQARGTPLQKTSLSKPMRDKLKASLGPEGYISSLSNIGNEVSDTKTRHILKNTANNNKGTLKATKTDIPNVKPIKKF